MNKITNTLLAIALAASSGLWAADPPIGEKPKEKTPAEVLYEKLLADNTKQADALYGQYLKALDVANQKILAGLEGAKKDMNDPKKGKLSITERAAAIEELDKKIAAVKEGALGAEIVEDWETGGGLVEKKDISTIIKNSVFEARYGSDTSNVDVTDMFKNAIVTGAYQNINGKMDGAVGGDPAPGSTKNVVVTYKTMRGGTKKLVIVNGQTIKMDDFAKMLKK